MAGILNKLQGTPCQLHVVKGLGSDLLAWMREEASGVFAVEFDGHCVTWDAQKKTISDRCTTVSSHPIPITTLS